MQAVNDTGDVVRIRKHVASADCQHLLGSSPGIQNVRRAIERACSVDAPILIVGEIGTGKSLAARLIHRGSARRDEPLVELTCVGISQMPVELAAAGKAVVLDGIDALATDMQLRLVRQLDSAGSTRVIACTSVDLDTAVSHRAFRLELLHRLNTIVIRLPTLTERSRADFEELLQRFVGEQRRRLTFARSAVDWLTQRPWPANVRELRNVVQRLAILSEREAIDVPILEELAPAGPRECASEIDELVDAALAAPAPALGRHYAVESAMIERAIELTSNDSAAARLLGMSRRAMLRRRARLAKGGAGDDDE